MKGILADHNIRGLVRDMVSFLEGREWGEHWTELNLQLFVFRDLGLVPEVADNVLWHTCQQQQIVLITANRNQDGPDSLEATIRVHNTMASLPVFTIASVQRFLNSKEYAERVAVRLLDYLLNIEDVRGAGRLYLP